MGQATVWDGGAPLGGVAGASAPVGTIVVREPGERRRRVGGFLAAVGGATIVAGSFADWVRADIRSEGILDGTGWRNVHGNVAHGPWLAAMGVVIVVVGATFVVGFRSRAARWAGIGLGIAAIALGVYEIVDIATAPASINASIQPGLPMCLAGALVGLIGLWITVGGDPPVPAVAPPPPPTVPVSYPSAPPEATASAFPPDPAASGSDPTLLG